MIARKQEETRWLPTVLNPEELWVKAQELAAAVGTENESREEFAEWLDQMKSAKKAKEGHLAMLHADTTLLAGIVESGLEEKDVECDWLYALPEKTAFLVRRDTGEMIESRSLRQEEQQTTINDSFREATREEVERWLSAEVAP